MIATDVASRGLGASPSLFSLTRFDYSHLVHPIQLPLLAPGRMLFLWGRKEATNTLFSRGSGTLHSGLQSLVRHRSIALFFLFFVLPRCFSFLFHEGGALKAQALPMLAAYKRLSFLCPPKRKELQPRIHQDKLLYPPHEHLPFRNPLTKELTTGHQL